jgi:hypothetical protein
MKYQIIQLKSLFERLDSVETKLLEVTFMVKEVKTNIPPSAGNNSKEMQELQIRFNQ